MDLHPVLKAGHGMKRKMIIIVGKQKLYTMLAVQHLTVFIPEAGKANGTAVIIAPGGAFHALSINSEGFDVAKWLVQKGVTCFVLKYRLVHSLDNRSGCRGNGQMG